MENQEKDKGSESRYSEAGFWEKIKNYAKVAGKEVIEKALSMYFASKDKDTPRWAKSIILGSLAYFIMPVDAIPDAILAAGYTDDLGVFAAALATVAVYIKQNHTAAAREKTKQWFGEKPSLS